MIKITKLTKRFGANTVIDDLSLEIPEGQKLAVIGTSGCGKSTLLRLLIRLEDPTKGAVFFNDIDISAMKEDQLMKMRSKVGMVFQSSALFDSMNVFDNVAFGLRQQGMEDESLIKRKVMDKLAMVDMDSTAMLMPSELSGGMQKRVSLARAIASDPKVILYDEPTTGLDPVMSTVIEDLMNKLTATMKATAVIVTHQLSTIFRTSDRIIMLHEGRAIEAGNVEQTKASTDPVIRNFIKGGLK